MQYFKTAVLRRKADLNGLVVYASAAIIKRKEPINRVPVGYGLSALRLCVWHDCSVFYFSTVGCHQEGLFTLGAEQREVFRYGILPDLGAGFAPAGRAQHPADLFTLHWTASLPVMRHTGDLLQLEAVFLADLRVFFPVYPAKEHLQRADPQAAIPVQLAVDDTGHAAF